MPENSVIIRHPRPEDLAGLQSLWAASFPEDCDGQFIPWYFQNRFQPENCWLLEQQGVLTAMCFAPEVHLQLAACCRLPTFRAWPQPPKSSAAVIAAACWQPRSRIWRRAAIRFVF